jgi:hypothetical protein
MSIPKRVLKIVARSINGVCLCKALLVVSPTEHILRGFVIERTTHKGRYNLWKVIAPLYIPMRCLYLDYSNIIGPRGPWLEISVDEIQDAADRVTGFILDGHLEHLKRLRGPKEFLEHISWMIGNDTDTFLFDYAMTQYMLGNHATCLATLEAMIAKDMPGMRRGDVFTWAQKIIPKLKASPSEVAEILQQFEKTNVEQFALAPTLIGLRPQIVSST